MARPPVDHRRRRMMDQTSIGEGYIGCGACYKKTSPLFPSTHCGRPHPTSTQVNTPKCRLYWKGCQMGHDPKGFWYKIHASYFYKGKSPRQPSGRVCWMSWRNECGTTEHGWKIGWPNLCTVPFTLESVCGWGGKLARIRSKASSNISREDHHRKIFEVGLLGYKQRSIIWNFVDGNGDGPENEWKINGDLFRFKTSCGPSKRRIGSTGSKNTGVFEPSQAYTNKIWILWLIVYL